MIDQSPHQLAKARKKEGLKGVTILEVRPTPPPPPLAAPRLTVPCPGRRGGPPFRDGQQGPVCVCR